MDNQTLIIKLIALADAPHMTEDEKSAAMLIVMHRHDVKIEREARLQGAIAQLRALINETEIFNRNEEEYIIKEINALEAKKKEMEGK